MRKVTVAVCTWNRAQLLDRTLDQMRTLQIPSDVDWELLVVNNNCTDQTDTVIEKYEGDLPIRRLFEARPGHSHARNRALAEMHGDLLLWTDDDVLVDPKWLAAYDEAAQKWPHAAYFGGPVEPLFESEPPSWIMENLDLLHGPLALIDLGATCRHMLEKEYPFGANMAFRRSLIEEMRFDTSLGRVGNVLVSGDDLEFVSRLKRREMPGLWIPSALVHHHVPTRRMTESYVWDWCVGAGITEVITPGDIHVKTVFGLPRWALRRYCESRIKLWLNGPRRGRLWLSAFRTAAVCHGVLKTTMALRKSGSPWGVSGSGAL